ncbi:lysozyme X-like [Cryptotermes secundus]|uniref:lysozyme X-like n=1 Tax=Cryptotermes secundus TaxID=105785 RepID=UPI000CD7D81C|nr:lysozyme X-like [Cryptotermes secundus]
MRAGSVLILIIMTAHTSLATILTQQQFLMQLRNYGVPEYDLATWLCIAEHESNLDTAAIGTLNTDGSKDHGIFQINDRYWCREHGVGGGCNINCAALRSDNLDAAIRCALHIKSRQGFVAWTTYERYCIGPMMQYQQAVHSFCSRGSGSMFP